MLLHYRILYASIVIAPVAVLLAVAGCSSDTSLTYPVEGLVTVNGQPASGVNIVFHSQPEQSESFCRPSARSDADGRFRLTSFSAGDGAMPGRYLISITRRVSATDSSGGLLGGGVPDAVATDQFRGRYANPQTSGFGFEVSRTKNTVPTIDLQLP